METRKRLGPSDLETGVAHDSEARDPIGGGDPRLGGGARRRDARIGGTCGTERGTRVCTSPLHHLTDIRCLPTVASLNGSLNSQRFNKYGSSATAEHPTHSQISVPSVHRVASAISTVCVCLTDQSARLQSSASAVSICVQTALLSRKGASICEADKLVTRITRVIHTHPSSCSTRLRAARTLNTSLNSRKCKS